MAKKLSRKNAKRLIDAIVDVDWDKLAVEGAEDLLTAVQAGGIKSLADFHINSGDAIQAVNNTAKSYAKDRAAELIGRKWVNGKLVGNPDAKWSIAQTTRDEIRNLIESAFKGNTDLRDLRQQILDAGAFSKSRSEMIARTEVSLAQNQGNKTAWKESGVVSKVAVLLSDDHDDGSNCECADIADGGPYEIDEVPDVPIHPNCWCTLSPVVEGVEE